MPELPEVETVRRGLARHAAGRTVSGVEVRHARTVRRQSGGAAQTAARLRGTTLQTPQRRGKYLWFPLGRPASGDPEGSGDALVAHLGMSGQFRLRAQDATGPRHDHVRLVVAFADGGPDLDFADQRTFGWICVEPLVTDRHGRRVPGSVAEVALDVLDPGFDDARWQRALRSRRTTVKRALLDQHLQSGIGNIYADEALWRARLHPERPTGGLAAAGARSLLAEVRAVLSAALDAGGTSFDRLYVDIDGGSGYFGRSLAVYGREGAPCPRCGAAIVREPFTNRSSHLCPRCQRRPRPGRPTGARPTTAVAVPAHARDGR